MADENVNIIPVITQPINGQVEVVYHPIANEIVGNAFKITGKEAIYVNTQDCVTTIRFKVASMQNCNQGYLHDLEFDFEPNQVAMVGVLDKARFANADGNCSFWVTPDDSNATVAIIKQR